MFVMQNYGFWLLVSTTSTNSSNVGQEIPLGDKVLAKMLVGRVSGISGHLKQLFEILS